MGRPLELGALLFEPVVSTRDCSLFALDLVQQAAGGSLSAFILGNDAAAGTEAGPLLLKLFSRLKEIPGSPELILGVSLQAFAGDSEPLTLIDLAAGTAGLDPGRIVLEVAPALGSLHPSLDAVDEVRALGFHVSLADSGLSEEGLRMLLELRPDYIRLWAGVVRGSSSDFFRRAILDSFSQLAWKFGALLIAGGADEPGDQATLLDAGVAFMKGRLAGPAIPWEGLVSASGAAPRSPVSTNMSTEQSFEDRSGRKHG